MHPMSRDRLSPRLVDRVRHALRPGWARSVMIRRGASVLLVVAAVTLTLFGHRGAEMRSVVVAARDLIPGESIVATDLTVREVPGGLIPAGTLRLTADGVGRTAVGPIGAGEMVTDSRLLSPRLPSRLTGDDDARLVPVRLSDESVATLLRTGDVVDVLTASAEKPEAAVLARAAVVALTSDKSAAGVLSGGATAGRPVLLAMDERAAHRVAAAALDAPITVVVH
ncbi:SAF domain-containing protein [Gordonia hankookensis]|uniref:Flagellar biosynthesis protein FlgA n=1 Tax=Gordonia hankookensis TaxID=589403 RepID=A0ABR7WEP8_9ACTN|nr:SAF domain-containing protein [Gordonia hankookensis]MBD1321264.1 flagellar biosynthesis protein FlgA [Gordonia hankookensis]